MTWFWINTRDKPGLLRAMMRALGGNSQISFEGRLSHLDFSGLQPIAPKDAYLQPSDRTGKEDFIVLPLTMESEAELWRRISAADHLADPGGIIHTQIGTDGALAFGAYDNFHSECVGVTDAVSTALLEQLQQRGVIRSFETEPVFLQDHNPEQVQRFTEWIESQQDPDQVRGDGSD